LGRSERCKWRWEEQGWLQFCGYKRDSQYITTSIRIILCAFCHGTKLFRHAFVSNCVVNSLQNLTISTLPAKHVGRKFPSVFLSAHFYVHVLQITTSNMLAYEIEFSITLKYEWRPTNKPYTCFLSLLPSFHIHLVWAMMYNSQELTKPRGRHLINSNTAKILAQDVQTWHPSRNHLTRSQRGLNLIH